MDRTGTVAGLGIGAGSVVDDRYRLHVPLGRSAAAGLWRATDLRLHRDVAIKLCRPDPVTAERDLARANLLAGITHPALATIFDAGIDFGPDGPCAYVVTELLDGTLLSRRLAYGPLPPRRIARIGSQVADALGHLHRYGVSHGAVSLANVVLRPDGTAKLADLETRARGTDASPQDDVRALGLVLLAAFDGLAGERQTQNATRRVWRRRRLTTGGRPRAVEWTELLQMMVAEDRSARPTAAEVAGRLAGLAAGSAAEFREWDEPTDGPDEVAPLSVGHWRAPTARGRSSRSRVRARGGRHRRAAAVQSVHRDGDDAAA